MSLFQCENCGCCENTALSLGLLMASRKEVFDWSGMILRCGMKLCSACSPTKFIDGSNTRLGEWHGKFDRVFLPKGEFKTNQKGNLEHIKTGSESFRDFEIEGK